ncbi:MAG: hypothetical protein WBM11_07450 [Terriglobales bacterium]
MPNSLSAREQVDLQHLTQVRALTAEVAASISAIEHNNLRQLQIAVANQERICNQLVTTKWTPSSLATGSAGCAKPASETREQIQTAYVTLAQLNRVYAGIVKRSQRSVELLSALYGNRENGYGPEPARSGTFQTLSCEA